MITHHDTMNRLLRALWDRMLQSGGDVAVAVEYRPEPRRVGDEDPGPHDLGPHGHCWWWPAMGRSWIRCHVDNLEPGDIWLPYSAIADPGAES